MTLTYDPQALFELYTHHLNEVILPFWLPRAIDTECGGYYTCYDVTGRHLLSKRKFTWSQGRMVWVLSKLASTPGLDALTRAQYLSWAAGGARFVRDYAILGGGRCVFVMDRQGTPQEQTAGQGYDTSIYADCFVILGLSRFASSSGDESALRTARAVYDSVLERLASGSYRTEPYPTPPGTKVHGIPMIMLNTSQELAQSMQTLGDKDAGRVIARASGYMDEIMDHFSIDGVVHEMIDVRNRHLGDSLLGRYINPGHTIEDMWFVMHQARATGRDDVIRTAARVVANTVRLGWDTEHGGLLTFADQAGGPPRGSTAGIEDEVMVGKVQSDWDNKLWWPHSEALYAALLAYVLTGDEQFWDLYAQVHAYTFATFPNPDPEIGEWIQIRNRVGEPESKVVALPVKDPFHIARNLILVLDLLRPLRA